MTMFNCFYVLGGGRKKKYMGKEGNSDLIHYNDGLETVQVKLEHPVKNCDVNELNLTSFSVSIPFVIQQKSTFEVKVVSEENPVEAEATEAAYEGEDEDDDTPSIKKDYFSDFHLQVQASKRREHMDLPMNREMDSSYSVDNEMINQSESKSEKDAETGTETIQNGHVSDPGITNTKFWASPELKRSCSNLERRDILRTADQSSPLRCQPFDDLNNLTEKEAEIVPEIQGSPVSVITPCSADRVILKKHSSSRVLSSRSRRLWWKLFLWSHRNLHKPSNVKLKLPSIDHITNQKGGYSSDTVEINRVITESGKTESPESFTKQFKKNGSINNTASNNKNRGSFHEGVSGSSLQNQWVAFCTESSSLTRVDEWVNSLEIQTSFPVTGEDTGDECIVFPPSPEHGDSPARSTTHMSQRLENLNYGISEEILYANNIIQSLNSSSTVAHIVGMGLKVLPTISGFSSLRTVNLSGNFIGSLPKGLHTLNLSRNKIVAIEGLRELNRLRAVDLSYNRISRVGHGLSNCSLIKELYLAGNKISDVEGLHRLTKLTVLDLSFNKITTTKALGQLVANYHTLLALNLLGNPIQSNIGEDQLRKAVSGLLPQLTYLNKQPIKPHRGREAAMDGVAKAALGNNGRARRKAPKRVNQGRSSSTGHKSNIGGGSQKSSHGTKSRSHHNSTTRRSSLIASSR
ncbi:PREDICTED: uncharacterized protein LOC104604715 isoform X2 [Nelumbo nucifera]|uniref:Uncharacterized protein LOC104604715 isoform X2 n=1 Tax=Nelumbo nucifera TaxID=4432 RepID=A0A1U8AJT5_NELNU|nr:PREDICTED: uncharacterized protein LOC104604715 isoform X2 [Nelumbo nucifera]